MIGSLENVLRPAEVELETTTELKKFQMSMEVQNVTVLLIGHNLATLMNAQVVFEFFNVLIDLQFYPGAYYLYKNSTY